MKIKPLFLLGFLAVVVMTILFHVNSSFHGDTQSRNKGQYTHSSGFEMPAMRSKHRTLLQEVSMAPTTYAPTTYAPTTEAPTTAAPTAI
mmetsp:Transcript_11782/g.16455  ORF Transcript_11782/g.16455 Transcript_11782/m.16455 type:complete len:89 (-) Transcript_11782:494-760(-)